MKQSNGYQLQVITEDAWLEPGLYIVGTANGIRGAVKFSNVFEAYVSLSRLNYPEQFKITQPS